MPELAAALAAQHISAAEEAPHLDGSDLGSDSDESCAQVHTLHGTHLLNLDVLVPILVPVASGASPSHSGIIVGLGLHSSWQLQAQIRSTLQASPSCQGVRPAFSRPQQ